MNYKEQFYNKYVSKNTKFLYGKLTIEDIKKQFLFWDAYFRKFLPQNKQALIMELGCGSGGFIHWLQSIGYLNAGGIDISSEQISEAKKFGIKNVNKADIKEFIKNKNEVYDIIFMRDILEHFTKDEILGILESVFKSIKTGGKIIIQIPNAENILSGRLRYGDFTHEVGFTADSIKQLLAVSGFKDISVFGPYPIIHGLKSLARFILWKFFELCLRFYLLVETGLSKGIFSQNIIAVAGK